MTWATGGWGCWGSKTWGKLQGRRDKSPERALGEVGTEVVTCRSPVPLLPWLRSAACAAGIRPQCAASSRCSGCKESVAATVRLSVQLFRSTQPQGDSGGAGRGWPLGNAPWVPAPPATWLLPAPVPAEGGARSALPRTTAGSGGSGHKTGRGMTGQRERQPCGAPVLAKTQVHSHPWSNAPCPGGSRSAGHLPPRALRGWEYWNPWFQGRHATSSEGPKALATASQKSWPKQHYRCVGIFPRKSCGPQLVSKQSRKEQTAPSCLFSTSPAACKRMHRSEQDGFPRSVPRLTKSEEVGDMHPCTEQKGTQVIPLSGTWRRGPSQKDRCLRRRLGNKQTRTSARASCCPGGIACGPLCSEQEGSVKCQSRSNGMLGDPPPRSPPASRLPNCRFLSCADLQ